MSSTEAVPAITADSIVGETMRAHPATTAIFFRRRMHCPGCPMSAFMTVREAAASYGLFVDELVAELQHAAASCR
jgi:hybrid cluster-associated redox disulfide protein